MGDYQPIYTGGMAPRTLTTNGDVLAGRVLATSGDDLVAHASADDATVVGVAAHDALSGQRVLVWPLEGVTHELQASGAIAADAGVVTDVNGTVKTAVIATASAAGTLIGQATSTAAGSPLKLRVLGRR